MKEKYFSLRILITWVISFFVLPPLLISCYFGCDAEFFIRYLYSSFIGFFHFRGFLSFSAIYNLIINLVLSYFFARLILYVYDKPVINKFFHRVIKYWYISLGIVILISLLILIMPHLYNYNLAVSKGDTKFCSKVWSGLKCYDAVANRHYNIHFCEGINDVTQREKCVIKILQNTKIYIQNHNDYCSVNDKLDVCIRRISLKIENNKPILDLELHSNHDFSSFLESTICISPLNKTTNLPQFPAKCIMRNDVPWWIDARNQTYNIDYSISEEITRYVKNGGALTVAYVKVNGVPEIGFIGAIGIEFNNETIKIYETKT